MSNSNKYSDKKKQRNQKNPHQGFAAVGKEWHPAEITYKSIYTELKLVTTERCRHLTLRLADKSLDYHINNNNSSSAKWL